MDLNNINMEEIEKIMSSLSAEDMEMLQGMAKDMFSGQGSQHNSRQQDKQPEGTHNSMPFGDIPIDFETIRKISSIMQKLNSRKQDERCDFLLSLKPLLSKSRQHKIDSAVQILRIMDLLPLIQEIE